MYKGYFFIYLLLGFFCSSFPVVHLKAASIIFSTQAQIDDYFLENANLETIEFSILIEGEDIKSLSAFQNIEQFNSSLLIRGCPQLKNLEGFNKLKYVKGYFFLHQNDSLENVDALQNLQTIGEVLDFTQNYALDNISSLTKLTEIGGLQITANNCLSSLKGLEGLTKVEGNIRILSNLSLGSLSTGLRSLDSHPHNLIIIGNRLNSLEGLENLAHVGGDLTISGSSVSNLSALQNLRHVDGSLKISNHKRLANLTHLAELQSIGGWLSLVSNPSITHLNGIENILIEGGLGLFGMTSLQNLHTLEHLNKIDGGFTLWDCPLVTSLEGLDHLTSLNIIQLVNNESLTDLIALEKITSLEGRLWINGNSSLKSLQGLHNINSIGSFLEVRSNNNLRNLKGLSGLTKIESNLKIMWNDHPEFTNLLGLEKLTKIGGYLQIKDNFSLNSLEGLGRLDVALLDSLLITKSPALSECAVESVCAYLQVPENISTIDNNLMGCNSVEEVKTACNEIVSVPTMNTPSDWQVFPNPSQGLFLIQGVVTPDHVIEVRNHLGQILLYQKNNSKTIDLSNFPDGLYWLHLKNKNGTLKVWKLVKH